MNNPHAHIFQLRTLDVDVIIALHTLQQQTRPLIQSIEQLDKNFQTLNWIITCVFWVFALFVAYIVSDLIVEYAMRNGYLERRRRHRI